MGENPAIRRFRIGALTLLTSTALLGGALAPSGHAVPGQPEPRPLADFYGQNIDWKKCGPDMADDMEAAGGIPPEYVDRIECGTVDVPKIYMVPDRGTYTLHMIRLKATGPGDRLGALVLNFGGPGGSGIEGLSTMADRFDRLNARYDLVAHDPRGVGKSTPVRCGKPSDQEEDLQEEHATPRTSEEARQLARAQRMANARCGKKAGDLIPWVGTVDSARDLDVLRSALDEDKLNYLGFSYGTKLGANYMHKFPKRSGRMVLDGVVDPLDDPREMALSNARAFQVALDNFTADCVKRKTCPLGDDDEEAQKELRELFEDLDGASLPTLWGDLDQPTFVNAIKNLLYSKQEGWPLLRQSLTQLAEGNGGLLVRLGGGGGASVRAQSEDEDAGDADDGMSDDAYSAINCRDTSKRYGPEDFDKAVDDFKKITPIFAQLSAAQLLNCTGWPIAGDNNSRFVDAPGAPKALLVSTVADPATPYKGGPDMAKALDNGSVVLTYEGNGHAAYIQPNNCVHQSVENYFFDGKLPQRNTTCK
ncbi:alpha/beta hydrolase [Streptomyces sp. A7024]|uniref:Alpha/beta hydrolase n=1 Tax=Streptomyces coryli TaxID=1128680 RepID=A0A6G4U6C1_9ACTN|nr:alpha/beta hydrolase [Streptomyces coryli]NGN66741.1 alpha/beta hydrolase [Streptomyces coryli]